MHNIELDHLTVPRFPLNEEIQPAKPTQKKSADISHLLLNARKLIENDETQLAKALLAEALIKSPANLVALKLLSQVFNTRSEVEQKITTLKAIVDLDPNFENLKNLADAYYNDGRLAQAMDVYMESAAFAGNNLHELFDIFKNMGNILVREKDYEGAEEYYNKALCLKKDADVLKVNLGTLAIQKSELEVASDYFKSALQLNPASDKAWVGLALIHSEKGDKELAKANVQRALDIDPFNKTALLLNAQWTHDFSEINGASELLQNYLAREEFDPEISMLLIQLFAQSEKWTEANLELDRFMLWNPQSEEAFKIEKALLAEGLRQV